MHEFFDDIVPHPEGVDPESQLIHERAYVVRAYRKDASTLLLRGAVRDQKPPGLYVPDDPEPLTMHHMIVDLDIAVPSLEIIGAKAVMEMHPHEHCRQIEDHYQNLVGLSIARGFTHKVRELFGGPRGCTHTTALLQAMAPVAIQSMWSFRMAAMRDGADEASRRTRLLHGRGTHAGNGDEPQHLPHLGRGRRPGHRHPQRRADGSTRVDREALRRTRPRPSHLAPPELTAH